MSEIINSVVREYGGVKQAINGMKKGEIASCPVSPAYAIRDMRAFLYRDHEGRFWGCSMNNIDPERLD